jgi:hypothetical protein
MAPVPSQANPPPCQSMPLHRVPPPLRRRLQAIARKAGKDHLTHQSGPVGLFHATIGHLLLVRKKVPICGLHYRSFVGARASRHVHRHPQPTRIGWSIQLWIDYAIPGMATGAPVITRYLAWPPLSSRGSLSRLAKHHPLVPNSCPCRCLCRVPSLSSCPDLFLQATAREAGRPGGLRSHHSMVACTIRPEEESRLSSTATCRHPYPTRNPTR